MGIDLLITVIDKTIRQKRRRLKSREIGFKHRKKNSKSVIGIKWNKGLKVRIMQESTEEEKAGRYSN